MSRPEPPAPLFRTSRLDAVPLAPADAPRLQEVFEGAGEHFRPLTGRDRPPPDAAERELASCAAAEGRTMGLLVSRETGEPLGAIGWWEGHPRDDLVLVGMLVILPGVRHRGFGREAMDGLAARAAERGAVALRAGAGRGDAGTHSILQALGFRSLDERRHASVERGRVMLSLFERSLGHG